MTHSIIPEGTKVRVTAVFRCGDVVIDEMSAAVGGPWEVYCYAEAGEGDDPKGLPYYLLDIPDFSFGGNYWAYPEHVEALS